MTRISDIHLDDATVAAARAGSPAALEAVYVACYGAIYTLIRRLVRRDAVAEDLLQETFADVIRHIGGFEGRAPLPMWIRAIAVRRSLMHLRSPWQRGLEWLEDLPGAEPVVAGEARRVDQASDLERALARLSPTARAVVWLHDVEGYTHEEIAAGLGRTPSFSKSQLARAHARLRVTLDPAPEFDHEASPSCTPISTN